MLIVRIFFFLALNLSTLLALGVYVGVEWAMIVWLSGVCFGIQILRNTISLQFKSQPSPEVLVRFLSGVLFLAPGVISYFVASLVQIPFVRKYYASILVRQFKPMQNTGFQSGRFNFGDLGFEFMVQSGWQANDIKSEAKEIKDVTPRKPAQVIELPRRPLEKSPDA